MTEPGTELQFDRAQFEAAPAAACAFCTRPLAGSYYDINGKLACESCRRQVEEVWTGGSGAARFAKATVYGVVVAAVGAIVYWGITAALKGAQWSLISIALGWAVGSSVRTASQGRGGWPYQSLAMFLTYTAIVGSYLPFLLEGIPEGTLQRASTVQLLVLCARLAYYLYTLPFFAVNSAGAGQGMLTLLIIGFGVWQAWKLNAKARIAISGPFNLAKPTPPLPPSTAPSDAA